MRRARGKKEKNGTCGIRIANGLPALNAGRSANVTTRPRRAVPGDATTRSDAPDKMSGFQRRASRIATLPAAAATWTDCGNRRALSPRQIMFSFFKRFKGSKTPGAARQESPAAQETGAPEADSEPVAARVAPATPSAAEAGRTVTSAPSPAAAAPAASAPAEAARPAAAPAESPASSASATPAASPAPVAPGAPVTSATSPAPTA